ncbi:retrovirus-related pol polyprotein from transposon TNT 1-94 [Tanacetum coccineum]|uniref:Retrovirus-related pol polyprotein from transposon TNT 1-94 n=1 Tax=Tanacetum coccineum TaxID=301880 RepID=A0ABQ5GHL7_9ASTR
MESNEQCIIERARHEQEIHNRLKRLNERKLQIQDAWFKGLENQSNTSGDESSRSRNECNDNNTSRDDSNIRPSYDTEPMVEVPYIAEYNVFAIDTQHLSNLNALLTHETDQNAVECDDERVALLINCNLKLDVDGNKNIQKQLKKTNTSLAHELKECKSILAKTSRTLRDELVDQAWEKHSHDHFRAPTAHDMEILIKTCLKPLAIKTQNDSFTFVHELKQEMHADLKYVESLEKEIDKLESDKVEFSNMYDILLQECVSNDVMCSYLHSYSNLDAHTELQCLYLHKVKECECLAQKLSKQTELLENCTGSSKNSPKHVSFQSPRESVGSNDMVHNYYLEEAKKKAQLQKDKALNTKPSVQQSVRLPNTTNGNKPKFRNFKLQHRNWPPSVSSCVLNRTVNITEPPRNQKPFFQSKDLACPTCKKCIYSTNHDECILKYLLKVHSCASAQKKDAQSHKTTKRYMPVEKKSNSNKHDRHIPIGQKFSPNKSSAVYLKTTPGLTWKPTGRIFTQVGLKWTPIRKFVETHYNTHDSASPLEKITHNPNTTICANSFSLSAEHPSDTQVFTVEMEILLEPTSNKFLVVLESVGISHETSVPRSSQQNGVVERRNRTLMEAARTMLIFAKALLFLWAKAVATACYTLNRSLVHTLHGKTYYELLKGKKPNLQYFRVFGSLCYPTNDYDDVGKLKAKADISGTKPFALVKGPRTTSVPHTKKQNANGSPSTTVISEGAPAVTESLLPHQIPLPDTSDSDVETLFDHVDSNVFDTYNAPETDSEASHSNSVNIDVTPNNQLPHVQKWTQAHPLENIIGDKDRPVSTRKQLETDAMWCFFNEFLTHVEPKNFKQALEHSCWIEAMQEEIHEFERLDVWILVPCPDNILIIPLKWIFKIKLDEYGRRLKNKIG